MKRVVYILLKILMAIASKICKTRNNQVLFMSFSGKSYSDNPKAISEKLHELSPDTEIVWMFNNPGEKKDRVPDYIGIKKNSLINYILFHATSKVWVDNVCKTLYTSKSNKQIYIQTWHGDRGFKKVLYDSPNIINDCNFYIMEENYSDLMVSGSEYGTRQMRSAFRYTGEIMQKGTPRNDILLNSRNCEKRIKKELQIPEKTNVLLYAPTYRNNAKYQRVEGLDLQQVLAELETKTQERWICLVRAHSAVKGLELRLHDNMMDVTGYDDMSELLVITDMLITDYSSCAGDFALTKKAIILFQNDRERYESQDRTFYFPMETSPFFIAKSQDELLQIIREKEEKDYARNCEEILKFYGTTETGKASEYVAKYILEKMED